MSTFRHQPVLLDEAIDLLNPCRGGIFVDGTLGGGGHSEGILKLLPPGSRLIGIDRDTDALNAAGARLKKYSNKFTGIYGNFFDIKHILRELDVRMADGILLDLGVSSYQLDTAGRGFSYKHEAPLDMRMDKNAPLRASDVVNSYPEQKLEQIIRDYGEERFARRIAISIAKHRDKEPIETTLQLANIVLSSMPAKAKREPQHPARRTFQAIRIEVNGELEGLDAALIDAESLLSSGGVLAVITFHSLEDRIVKRAFQRMESPCTCDRRAPVCTCGLKPTSKILTRKPILPGQDEIMENPRSASAKLRAIRKL